MIYRNVLSKHLYFFSLHSCCFFSKCSSVSRPPVPLLSTSCGPQVRDGAASGQTLTSVWERGLHGNVLDRMQSRAPGFYLKHARTVPGGWAQRRPPANETVVPGHCYYTKSENQGQWKIDYQLWNALGAIQSFLFCFISFWQDDGPRVYPTAPQPVPVLFSLDGIVLERLDDGILSLRRESFGFVLQQLLRLHDICAVTC